MPTTDERLASLEARLDAMSDLRTAITDLRGDMGRQFTELRDDTNRQFTELRGDMNGRFADTSRQFTELREDMNRRLATLDVKGDRHFTWLVGTQVALLLAVVGALVGAYYR